MKAWTRWQNWVSLVLGVILFITPWVFGTATNTASSWDAWIIGVIGVILALLALAYVSAAWIPCAFFDALRHRRHDSRLCLSACTQAVLFIMYAHLALQATFLAYRTFSGSDMLTPR